MGCEFSDEENLIRRCTNDDFETIYRIVNDAAQAYKGVIPPDCWKDPYMPREELRHEIAEGVEFWGYEDEGGWIGVMGIQPVQDVALIRHAYVCTPKRNQGVGGTLLSSLIQRTSRPILVGTWAAASWAIRFYEKHGFRLVSTEQKDQLLGRYWSISPRQTESSVVLADEKWFEINQLQIEQ